MIIVSGLAGSGTSRISEHLHRSGIPMGTTFAAPPAGSDGYIDWEDYLFVVWCGMPALMKDDPGRVLDYCKSRFERSGVWGVKSPLLLPHLDLWRQMARQMHSEFTLVLSERRFEDCQNAMSKWLHMDPAARDALLAWNEKCREHWQREQARALMIPYDWQEFPVDIGEAA